MTTFAIKAASLDDAPALLALGHTLLGETDFYRRLPAERAWDVDQMRDIVALHSQRTGWAMGVAWIAGNPIGEVSLYTGDLERTAHTGTLGIGVLKNYWGQSVGRALMQWVEEQAEKAVLERLELTVASHNARAQDFYRRLGYKTEGRQMRSIRYGPAERGGPIVYADEIMMAKWIGPKSCIDL